MMHIFDFKSVFAKFTLAFFLIFTTIVFALGSKFLLTSYFMVNPILTVIIMLMTVITIYIYI